MLGVSGASGTPYALALLRALQAEREGGLEVHLVATSGAARVMALEGGPQLADLKSLVDVVHAPSDLGASVASGSFETMGMIVAPCSAGTLAKIAHGFADNLLTRAAHVTLKERRPLVLLLREDPLSRPMLQNMLSAHDAGATLLTGSASFYHAPENVDDLLHFVALRTLDQIGLRQASATRWREE